MTNTESWDATCECGHAGRVVDRIDGRKEDYVITKRGSHLGRLDHIFKDLVRIREAQIRQTEPGRMQIWVVRGDGYGADDERALRQEVLKRVGDEVDFEVEYKDAIPRTSRGKLRFVVSTLETGQIDSSGS
jgi:phenylacetate-coenzyme A ligase PaaK-like adenylate-forming protein